jgi:hypothetical protein
MIEVQSIATGPPPVVAGRPAGGSVGLYIDALIDGREARSVVAVPLELLRADMPAGRRWGPGQLGAMWGVALAEGFNELAGLEDREAKLRTIGDPEAGRRAQE